MKFLFLFLFFLFLISNISGATVGSSYSKGVIINPFITAGTGGGTTTNNYYITTKGNPPYLYNDSTTMYFNETKLNETVDLRASGLGDNSSWNQTLANSLYAGIEWNYNQTILYYADEDWINKNSSNGFEFNDSKLATQYFNATQSSAIAGTVDGGTLTDTQHKDGHYDGNTFNFTEASGSPGLDMRMNFTDIVAFTRGIMRYKTSALAGAYPVIQVWDYDESAWENYPPVSETLVFATIEQGVFDDDDHISGGVVQMRLYKASNGNVNNHYYVDWIAISKGYGTPSGEEVDPYSIHRDGSTSLTGNWDAGLYNITTDWFKGRFNWTVLNDWLSFDGATLIFNETRLNDTIDLRAGTGGNMSWNQTLADTLYLNRSSEDLYLSTYNATYDATTTQWNANYSILIGAVNNASYLSTYNESYHGSLNNASYLTTYNATYHNYATNVSINYTKVTFDLYNSTWDDVGGGDNESWNQTLANSLYIATGNLSIYNGLINNASYLSTYNETYAGSVNNESYLTTYNDTYDVTDKEWDGNKSSIAYMNRRNTGSFNITGSFTQEATGTVGMGGLAAIDTRAINAQITPTSTTGGIGMWMVPACEPASAGTVECVGIAGYTYTTKNTFKAGTEYVGLAFGNFFMGNPAANINVSTTGAGLFGIAGWGANLTLNNIYGLKAVGFDNSGKVVVGGSSVNNILHANNSYAVYVYDNDAATGAESYTNRQYQIYVENPTRGTANYQVMLMGSGSGAGIRFFNESGPRIHALNASDLVLNSSTVYATGTVSAQVYVDRSTEYDKLKYGEASSYLNDVSLRTTTLDAKGTVVYNHTADPEFLQYSYQYQCNCTTKKVCEDVWREGTDPIKNQSFAGYVNECSNIETCQMCSGIGRDIGGSISWLRQTVYEQKVRIDTLELELCKKDPTYSWCI